MNRKQHKRIFKFAGNVDANVSPVDVQGIDLDNFDYFFYLIRGESGSAAYLDYMLVNGQSIGSSTDYGRYRMFGRNGSATCNIEDTPANNYFRMDNESADKPSVLSCLITGESSTRKFFDIRVSSSDGGKRDGKYSYYYDDEINPLTSFQITNSASLSYYMELFVYQIPKGQNIENIDLIGKFPFSGIDTNTNPITFSNLDGDSDCKYLLRLKQDADSILSYPTLIVNDNVTNGQYVMQEMTNNDGATLGRNFSNTDSRGFIPVDDPSENLALYDFIIHAETGKQRIIESYSTVPNPSSNRQQVKTGGWYLENILNITNLKVKNYYSGQTQSGEAYLYKIINKSDTIDYIPMKTPVREQITGNFQAGLTISNIGGDGIQGPIKMEFNGVCTANNQSLKMRLNGSITGYSFERLTSVGGSLNGGGTTETDRIEVVGINATNTSSFTVYIYTSTGLGTVVIIESQQDGDETNYKTYWDSNTEITELNTIDLYAGNIDNITGELKVSIEENNELSTGAFAVTYN